LNPVQILHSQAGQQSLNMAEFVRAQIFGTTFEITSRYAAGYATRSP
jgi:hypothetical protein